MSGPRYVEGEPGDLRTWNAPPRITRYTTKASGEVVRAMWPGSRSMYAIKRGALDDFSSAFTGKPVKAREIPESMHAEIDALEAEIARAAETLRELRASRQLLLEIAAARGRKVKVST